MKEKWKQWKVCCFIGYRTNATKQSLLHFFSSHRATDKVVLLSATRVLWCLYDKKNHWIMNFYNWQSIRAYTHHRQTHTYPYILIILNVVFTFHLNSFNMLSDAQQVNKYIYKKLDLIWPTTHNTRRCKIEGKENVFVRFVLADNNAHKYESCVFDYW